MAPASRTKNLIKGLCPPMVWDLIRERILARPRFRNPGFIWEGVYKDRQSVPTKNGHYDNDARISEFVEWARCARAQIEAGKTMDVPCACHEALCLLAASIAPQGCVRVLDFGGGVGLGFLQLLSSLRSGTTIQYDVVDLGNMCAAGRELFAGDPRIHFHTAWPAAEGKVDIVYASAVLPYIDDFTGLLRQFASVEAKYILLNQLAAGAFPTYAAKQLNLPGQTLAYWFLNLQEVIDVLAAAGYACAYETQAGPEYDQSNYPPLYRVGRMRTVLFVRRQQMSAASAALLRSAP